MRGGFCLLAACLLAVCSSEASEPAPSERLSMTYAVKELPVWSEGGEFDPGILVEFLKSATANPEAPNKAKVKITPLQSRAALVMVADVETHEQVWDILARLRGDNAGTRPDFQKLLRRQQADAIHRDELQLRLYRMEREQLELRRQMSLRDQPANVGDHPLRGRP